MSFHLGHFVAKLVWYGTGALEAVAILVSIGFGLTAVFALIENDFRRSKRSDAALKTAAILLVAFCIIGAFRDELHAAARDEPAVEMEYSTRPVNAPKPEARVAPSVTVPKAATPVAAAQATSRTPEELHPGSVADRNRNPLNIKMGLLTRWWAENGHAQLGGRAADGGYFLRFDSAENGLLAARDLLCSSLYAELSLNDALRLWSNNGYDDSILSDLEVQTVSALSAEDLARVLETMSRREGFSDRDGLFHRVRPRLLACGASK